MEKTDLNTKITAFLQSYGKVYTRDEWRQKYDSSYRPSSSGGQPLSSSGQPSSSGSASATRWQTDPKSGKQFYIDPKTKKTIWKE